MSASFSSKFLFDDPSAEKKPSPPDEAVKSEKLDADQRRAVGHEGGPLIVLAGPGAGKTRVIVHRVARLLAPREEGGFGADPNSVLALAFTIRSAAQLREKLAEIVGPRIAFRVRAATSHAFGASIVDRFGSRIGLPRETRIADSAERRTLAREVIESGGLFGAYAGRGMDRLVADLLGFVERCHTDGVDPERVRTWCEERRRRLEEGALAAPEAADEGSSLEYDEDCARFFERYDALRLERGLLTFDDFINLPIRILRESADAAARVRSEVRHIVVDEFQDWNPAQITLLSLLAPPASSPDVCVVGDDDQSIYAFRGADDRAFERFAQTWTQHKTITLAKNYRSAKPIVDAAHAVISRASERFAPDKRIVAAEGTLEPGAGVEAVELGDFRHDGVAIAAMIAEDRARSGRPFSNYAVIARTHNDLARVASELDIQGVPINVRQRVTPLDDDGVKDLLAWMRALASKPEAIDVRRLLMRPPVSMDPQEAIALDRAFRAASSRDRGLDVVAFLRQRARDSEGVRRLLALYDRLSQSLDQPADLAAEAIMREAGLACAERLDTRGRKRRIESLAQALGFIRKISEALPASADLTAFLDHYDRLDQNEQRFVSAGDERLDTDPDEDEAPDAVALLTAHNAKGAEFDTVFITRVGAHGFPSARRDDSRLPESLTGRRPLDAHDEERRLFYVACTRAERRLVLLAKRKRNKKTSSVDFFLELAYGDAGLDVPIHDADEIIARSGVTPPAPAEPDTGLDSRDARLRRIAAGVRAGVLAFLGELAEGPVSKGRLEEMEAEIPAALRRLADLADAREGRPPSRMAEDDPLRAQVTATLEGDAGEAGLFTPPKGPLRLSYTQLYEYMEKCPRCFYVKYVLRLQEPSTPHMLLGSAAHVALERFYGEYGEADAGDGPRPGLERLLALGERALAEKLPPDAPIDEAQAQQLRALLETAWSAFHDPEAHVLEIERSFAIPYESGGVTHEIRGKIDRLDQLPGGGFCIIDYKTGQSSKALLEPDKKNLQMGIYALALAETHGEGEPCEGVAEFHVLSSGDRGRIDLSALDLDKIRNRIDKAIAGILGGEFPKKTSCRGHCWIFDDV